jgi:hypothetical protein
MTLSILILRMNITYLKAVMHNDSGDGTTTGEASGGRHSLRHSPTGVDNEGVRGVGGPPRNKISIPNVRIPTVRFPAAEEEEEENEGVEARDEQGGEDQGNDGADAQAEEEEEEEEELPPQQRQVVSLISTPSQTTATASTLGNLSPPSSVLSSLVSNWLTDRKKTPNAHPLCSPCCRPH